jgi:hypothetical protein
MKFANIKIVFVISLLIAVISTKRRALNEKRCSKKIACPKERVCCASTNEKGKIISSICQFIVQGQVSCPDRSRPTLIQYLHGLTCGTHKTCENNGKCCQLIKDGWVHRAECVDKEESCLKIEKEVQFKPSKGKARRRY